MKLPIGLSDFREIIEQNYCFVDKSLFIKDVIDDTKVILITRPRRFGKTLNLSMLRYFFAKEIDGKSPEGLFDNLNIKQAGKEYLQHQGQYPVIFITFKEIKNKNFKEAYEQFCKQISGLYGEFRVLLSNDVLYEEEKFFYESILKQQANEVNILSSLKDLTKYLYRYYGVKPIVLIDEYDTPIQSGYMHGYYQDVVRFLRNFLGAGLKDNSNLYKAVLTGILRVSKESLFSDLNNIKVYSLLHSRYGEYFGFTEQEVNGLLHHANLKNKGDIKDWYNGYQFGNTVIYNPWSIINCIFENGKLEPYWVNTSDNALIKDLIISSEDHFRTQFEQLLQGLPVETIIDEHMVFNFLKSNELSVWTLFLMAGYLKVITQKETDQGLLCTLAIPNREVRNLYRRIIELWLSDNRALSWYNQFLNTLLKGEMEDFEEYLKEIFLRTISSYDVSKYSEAFYHGLMLGFTASLDRHQYQVKSNRESGYGRYDIAIIPKDNKKLGVIMEFKVTTEENLEKSALEALKQIKAKQYETEISSNGINKILKIGIAFSGKKLQLEYQKNEG